MLAIRNRTTGNTLDIVPGQEITFTLENPLFTDDRLPVAVSTGIELALTPNNKMECGFVEAMMLPPLIQTIPIAIILSGVEIFVGELQFDEFSDCTLKYTFVGKSAMEIINGKIYEIQCENYKGQSLGVISAAARGGALPDFGMPMIVRKNNIAKFEYWRGQTPPECSAIDKYANWLHAIYPYVIPAVKVDYLLNKIIPGIPLPSIFMDYAKHLAILGLYKPATWRNEQHGIPLTWELYSGYLGEFNVADSLPDITKIDFISNLLKMFCATMFSDGDNYCVLFNTDVLEDQRFTDWTNNVTEVYSIVCGQAELYSISYSNNETQTFNPAKQDKPEDGLPVPDSTLICTSYEALIHNFKASQGYLNFKIESTGDIYSGMGITANLNPDTIIPMMDMVYQAGLEKACVENSSDNTKNHDITIDFTCSKSIPANVTYTSPITGVDPLLLRGVSPIIDIPAIDNARSTEVYIGLLFYQNFFVQGNYFTPTIPYNDPGEEKTDNSLSIAIGGKNGLFNVFHKSFAEWYTKKKDSIKADVFLSPTEIAALRLWKKVMIYNRLYFIKTMELTISDKTDIVFANAEFIEV